MAKLCVMTIRRLLLLSLIGALLAAPQAAWAREIGTSWTSETEGLPGSTMQGIWTEEPGGRAVSLNFAGGHVIQPGTTFEARWLTPFTVPGKRPRFETGFEIENINEFGKNIVTHETFRYRIKGEPWSDEIVFTNRLRPGVTVGYGGSSFLAFYRDSVQFEWTFSGTIKAPTTLRGSVDAWTN